MIKPASRQSRKHAATTRLALALAAVTIAYAAFLHNLSDGAAFEEFRKWCASSPGIRNAVGTFEAATIDPLVPALSDQIIGGDSTSFTACVVGSRAEVKVRVAMLLREGHWSVDEAEILVEQ